jgi:AcrR family transcriptional regulator
MEMKARERDASMLIWERPEPIQRAAPGPLSRDSIVTAALEIADREGLAAVSFRRVAALLNVGAMRFYTFVESKEELLDLLIDSVFAEMLPARRGHKEWKYGVRSLALRMRSAALKHPWIADLLGGRPHLGPNALAYLEQVHRILRTAIHDIDSVALAARSVYSYVLGAVRSELSERQAESRSGQTKRAWQASQEPYLRRMIAYHRFVTLAEMMDQARDFSPEQVFDSGLETLLLGIEAHFL